MCLAQKFFVIRQVIKGIFQAWGQVLYLEICLMHLLMILFVFRKKLQLITVESYLNKVFFAGGSSGAVSAAIEKYANKIKSDDIVVSVFPDRGERYLSTIYNDEWCKNMYGLML